MKKIGLALVVCFVLALIAAPAMAGPLEFLFSGSAVGALGPNDVDVDFTISFVADTANLVTGATFVNTGQIVDYYGNLQAYVSFTDFLGDITPSTQVNIGIAQPLYLAYAPATGSDPAGLGLGIWDPALFNDVTNGLLGDLIAMDVTVGPEFMTAGGSFTTEQYLLGGATMTLLSGVFAGLDLVLDQAIITGEVLNPHYDPNIPDTGPQFEPVFAPLTVKAPEPSILLLFGAGLLGLGIFRKRM